MVHEWRCFYRSHDVACRNGSVPEWLKCARRPEMARAPTKLSARNVRTIIIHKTYVLARYVQCDAGPFWHANVQYNGEPFWHANVQCDAEPFWHAESTV